MTCATQRSRQGSQSGPAAVPQQLPQRQRAAALPPLLPLPLLLHRQQLLLLLLLPPLPHFQLLQQPRPRVWVLAQAWALGWQQG